MSVFAEMAVAEGVEPALKIRKLNKDAVLPQRATEGSAGYDLCCIEDKTLRAGTRDLFKIGQQWAIPKNFYGRIAARSGLAWKRGIEPMAGVIDSDYRGEVGVLLKNTSSVDVEFKKGEAIAQLILEKHGILAVVEVYDEADLGSTDRGKGGFGSTDVVKDVAAE